MWRVYSCERCEKLFKRRTYANFKPARFCGKACRAADSGDRTRGRSNATARLTEEQVRFILSSPMSLRELERAGIATRANAHLIRSRKTWRHLNQ